MNKIAILIDLELSKKSGGHVKYWQRIVQSLKKEKLDYQLEFFFLGKEKKKIKINEFINLNIIKPIISSLFETNKFNKLICKRFCKWSTESKLPTSGVFDWFKR